VEASDGLYADWVRVGWDMVSEASSYEVFRATTATGTKLRLGTPATPPYDDVSAAPGASYFYWVSACRAEGCSAPGGPDEGKRAITSIDIKSGATRSSVTHRWRRIRFPTAFADVPVLVAQIVSERSSDPGHIDLRGVSQTGFSVRVEEDLAADRVHRQAEKVHWIAVQPGDYGILKAGKTGAVVTHQWHQVTFPSPFPEPPALVAEIVSENDGQNAHIDIREVTRYGFAVRIEEDMRLDGRHSAEAIHWIAALPGRHGRLLAGTTGPEVTHQWARVTFATRLDGSRTPVLVAQLVSENEPDQSHVDLKGVSPLGFSVRVEEASGADGRHRPETVHYLAVQR
jgi:hypothetical protein